jgi:RNA polymerase sigma-70 factor (ECF subfamily)
MKQTLDQWFATQILSHEAALMRYLRRVWSRTADIQDLRQETYARVYESARKSLPRAPKSFLFATARHLIVDRLRRDRIVSIDYTQDVASLNVLVDELSPDRRLSSRQELQRLAEAYGRLSEMARAVIWLRRVEGLSQREAAQRLGIHEGALEGYMWRGLQAMADALLGSESRTEAPDTNGTARMDERHGQPND